MRNAEGIKNIEILERDIEKNGIFVDENVVLEDADLDFSVCAITSEEKICEFQELKETLLSFEDCAQTEKMMK